MAESGPRQADEVYDVALSPLRPALTRRLRVAATWALALVGTGWVGEEYEYVVRRRADGAVLLRLPRDGGPNEPTWHDLRESLASSSAAAFSARWNLADDRGDDQRKNQCKNQRD